MASDPRVSLLLEEIEETGLTPEEVCRHCPELLREVREGWRRLRACDAQLDALFPDATFACPTLLSQGELPRIAGYEIEQVLGRGGMGVVLRARHLRLGRVVAVKMMLAGVYAGPQERERFQREARAVAALQHPNIVQVYDVGDHEGQPFFTMELLEQGSLAETLGGAPQSARDAAGLLTHLASAIEAAHRGGIVHRDLKPANIFLAGDGVAKIGDFGLARRLDGETPITRTGDPMGTPSYMSPEQARQGDDAVGPAADIYALGAILYELLTGRPPFRAETAAETIHQVLSQEPATPSRLNASVPRDIETICLKCLHKEPHRRYASAIALAEDLGRFLRGEAIAARPVGPVERTLQWTRRHPSGAALVATALALVGLASGGSVWLVQQQAQRRTELHSEVDTAVAQAESLRKQLHFHEARQWLNQARQQLEPAGPDDLRQQVKQAQADLELAANLDAARLRAATPMQGRFKTAGAGSAYAEALYEETLAKATLNFQGEVGDAAARVRDSALSAELIAALDDSASITADPARREWLLAVARAADPDPSRDRLRQPALWDDGPGLAKTVNEVPADELSVQLTTALGRVLLNTGGDAVPLLRAAQIRYPQDFWLNLELGWALYESGRSDDALGFYRVALALRPRAVPAYNGVALTLAVLGRHDEAIGYYHQALNIDSNFAMAHYNLGLTLWAKGRQDEAIQHYRNAIRLDPKASALAHNHLAFALRAKGRLDDAIGHLQEAVRLDPNLAVAHSNLGEALRAKGWLDEAMCHHYEAVRLDPNLAVAHHNLGAALGAIGRTDEAIGHYQEAIRLDPKASATAHNNLGFALRAKGRLDDAIAHLLEAVRLDPNLAVARHNLFLCRYAAASAAVRASVGQGSQEKRPGEAERAGLRRRALDWLRADLELRTEQLQGSKAVDWTYLSRWPLSAWQTDPALADVRDRAALSTLPDAEREQWQRLWADVAALVAADLLEQGRAHAARRDWDQAADCCARALKRGATDEGHFWFEYAAVLVLSGDRQGYANACAHMVERFGKAGDLRAYHVARACTLAPNLVAETSLPTRLAETELKGSAGQFWSLTEQGALHYRAGRFAQAVELFEQSLRADSAPGKAVVNWLWLALAQQRLGKAEEARRWLDRAATWLDQYRDGMPDRAEAQLGLHLHNWLEAHALRREAEALVRPAEQR